MTWGRTKLKADSKRNVAFRKDKRVNPEKRKEERLPSPPLRPSSRRDYFPAKELKNQKLRKEEDGGNTKTCGSSTRRVESGKGGVSTKEN